MPDESRIAYILKWLDAGKLVTVRMLSEGLDPAIDELLSSGIDPETISITPKRVWPFSSEETRLGKMAREAHGH